MKQKIDDRHKDKAAGRKQSGKEKQRSGQSEPHLLEWVVSGVASALVLGVVGFILYQALGAARAEPDLHVIAERIEPTGGGFRVAIRAVNRGGATAASVHIEGRIERDGQTVETSRITLDFVPAYSAQTGALLFSRDPRSGRLRLQAKGYAHP